jgi:hypothetical protein
MRLLSRFLLLQGLLCSPRWSPAPRELRAGRSGALLGGVTAASGGRRRARRLGGRLGRLGILGGAFVGVPAGVFAVYRRYQDVL